MNYRNIELPSKCAVYNITPDQFQIRTLTGADEMALSELTSRNFETKLCTVMDRFIDGISSKDLTVGDRLYLLIWQKIQSYGSDYRVNDFICGGCAMNKSHTFDLALMETKELGKFDDTVTLSDGTKVTLRPMLVRDELLVSKYESNGNSSWLYRLALTIVDAEKDIMELVSWLGELPAVDIKEIRNWHKSVEHGTIMELEYECPTCGWRGQVAIPFRPDLLISE